MSAALGMAGLTGRERRRLSLLLAGFEMVMPIVGYLGGGLLGRALGDVADYRAGGMLVAAGLLVLRHDDAEEGEALAQRMPGLATIGLARA